MKVNLAYQSKNVDFQMNNPDKPVHKNLMKPCLDSCFCGCILSKNHFLFDFELTFG